MESERKKKNFSVLNRIENLPKQSEFFNWQLTKSKERKKGNKEVWWTWLGIGRYVECLYVSLSGLH